MNADSKPQRPAIYVRISKDREGLELGVKRQREDCAALVASRGWPDAEVYQDNDVSAYSGKVRPAYKRLLEDLEAGTVDAVVAWNSDRLHRKVVELEHFLDIVKRKNVMVETVQTGRIDLTTPSGRAVAVTLAAWARYESENKGERIKRKHLELAENGKAPTTGVRPFGYSLDWSELVPEEAALVREGVDRILAGESLRGLAKDWNDRGITTTVGKRWQQWPLKRMLTSARNAGIRELVGYERHPDREGYRRCRTGKGRWAGQWPAIIDEPTLERVRAVLGDPSRRTSTTNARSYLLSGFLRCSECGKPLRARPRQDKVRRYVCASGPMFGGCGAITIVAEPLEELVGHLVVEWFAEHDVDAAVRDVPATDDGIAASTLAADRERLEDLARRFGEGEFTLPEWQAIRKPIEARIAETTARMAQDATTRVLEPLRGAGADVRALWESQGFDQRRAVIAALIDHVMIGPAIRGRNRFDPDRVSVEWRA